MAENVDKALAMLHPMREPPQPTTLAPVLLTLALGCAAALVVIVLALRVHRRRASLREASSAELARTRALAPAERVAAQAALLRRLVRRVAGEEAARLQGAAWLATLDETFSTRFFTGGAGTAYGDVLYAPAVPDAEALHRELETLLARLRPPRRAPPRP